MRGLPKASQKVAEEIDTGSSYSKCNYILQFIAKQPLDKLVPLIKKAAEANAGKFGEWASTRMQDVPSGDICHVAHAVASPQESSLL